MGKHAHYIQKVCATMQEMKREGGQEDRPTETGSTDTGPHYTDKLLDSAVPGARPPHHINNSSPSPSFYSVEPS